MHAVLLCICFLLVSPVSSYAQHPLVDPGIPNGETAMYAVTAGKDTAVMTQRIVKKNNNSRVVYEVISESSLDDMKLIIDASRMTVEYSWVRRKRPGLVVETETKTVTNTIKTEANELSVSDFSGLLIMLRGFPFGKLHAVKLRMAQGSGFVLNAVNTRMVDVKIAGNVIRCYEIELALDGFLGAFMPKTYFWYSQQRPHYLVRYQGQMAGPGSPPLVMELTGYHIK
jgi:hypothetical protein